MMDTVFSAFSISNKLIARILEQLADRVITDKAQARVEHTKQAHRISLDDL